MKRAIGYVRVSTEEQSREGCSLEMQEAKLRAYCQLHELNLVEVIRDGGVSGGKALAQRPGGAQVLEAVAKGEVSSLIVFKLDRLGRRTLDVLQAVEHFTKRKVALHSISEQLDTNSAIGRFVLRTLASLAEMERDQIRERTRTALQHLKSEGRAIGRAPRGSSIINGQLVTDRKSEGFRVFQRARELRESGSTFAAIADQLNVEGFQPERGRRFWDSTVRRLLNNRLAEVHRATSQALANLEGVRTHAA